MIRTIDPRDGFGECIPVVPTLFVVVYVVYVVQVNFEYSSRAEATERMNEASAGKTTWAHVRSQDGGGPAESPSTQLLQNELA